MIALGVVLVVTVTAVLVIARLVFPSVDWVASWIESDSPRVRSKRR